MKHFPNITAAPPRVGLVAANPGNAAIEWEVARQRRIHDIPALHLTPTYIDLAIAKAWTPLPDGSFSAVRMAAEAAVAVRS